MAARAHDRARYGRLSPNGDIEMSRMDDGGEARMHGRADGDAAPTAAERARDRRQLYMWLALLALAILLLLLGVYAGIGSSWWLYDRTNYDGLEQEQEREIDRLRRRERQDRRDINELRNRTCNASASLPCITCTDNRTLAADRIDTDHLDAVNVSVLEIQAPNGTQQFPVVQTVLELEQELNSIEQQLANATCNCTGANNASASGGGVWNASAEYPELTLVSYQNQTYISLTNETLGVVPGTNASVWSLLSSTCTDGVNGTDGAQGNTGATGAVGAQGNTGAIGATGAVGAQGNTGNSGATGATGADATPCVNGSAGAVGATGATGAVGPVGVQPLGVWSSATAYVARDLVTYNGSMYLANASNTNQVPSDTSAFWTLYAQQGDPGAVGATGAQGNTGAGVQVSGAWSSVVNYANGTVVGFNGSAYVSLIDNNLNIQPDTNTSAWAQIGAAGLDGQTGNTGNTGANGYAVTTGTFVQPPPLTNVTVPVDFVDVQVGQLALVRGAGYYQVQEITGLTLTLQYPNASWVDAAAPPSTIVGTGAFVFPVAMNQPGQNGSVGPQGTAGAVGAQGNTGATGATGNTGNSGAQGNTGNSGATGAVGAQGNTGNTGVAGNTGNTGVAGNTGTTGATGAVGAQGNTGNTGVAGNTGNTGATGAVGAQGNTGNTGVAGNTGNTGATGAVGAQGNTGNSGAQGNTGNTGATGATGGTAACTQGGTNVPPIGFRASFCTSYRNTVLNPLPDIVGTQARVLVFQVQSSPNSTIFDYNLGGITFTDELGVTVNVAQASCNASFISTNSCCPVTSGIGAAGTRNVGPVNGFASRFVLTPGYYFVGAYVNMVLSKTGNVNSLVQMFLRDNTNGIQTSIAYSSGISSSATNPIKPFTVGEPGSFFVPTTTSYSVYLLVFDDGTFTPPSNNNYQSYVSSGTVFAQKITST